MTAEHLATDFETEVAELVALASTVSYSKDCDIADLNKRIQVALAQVAKHLHGRRVPRPDWYNPNQCVCCGGDVETAH